MWVNSSTINDSPYQYYRQATNWVLHPDFKWPSLTNDIGLVFLDDLVKGVPRVKINRDDSVPVSENPPPLTSIGLGASFLNVSDWGDIYREFPNFLQEASLNPVSNLPCLKRYGSWFFGESSGICAGGDGVKATCSGDSGGPLLVKKSAAQNDVQVGIVSAGPGVCVLIDVPNSFTRVSSFASWIDEQICTYSMDTSIKCPT